MSETIKIHEDTEVTVKQINFLHGFLYQVLALDTMETIGTDRFEKGFSKLIKLANAISEDIDGDE